MLNKLKERLSNALQESVVITDSLQQHCRQRLSGTVSHAEHFSNGNVNVTTLSETYSKNMLELNITAGCNLLYKFEVNWERLHEKNGENAKKSDKIATQIGDIEKRALVQRTALNDFKISLSEIPKLKAQLNESCKKIYEINDLATEILKNLEGLEDLCEECNFQELLLKKQFELSQYKQKKMKQLECYRQNVAMEYGNKIEKHATELLRIQRERQAVFDEAFQCDLEEYQQNGALKKFQIDRKKLALEDVILDSNDRTKDDLENFLDA